MANRLHLSLLRKGAEVWNEWRQQHPNVKPDLHLADLRRRRLIEVDLRDANLAGANLAGANLGSADLSRADLRCADLRGAKLSQVRLTDADLTQADLSEAMLNDASLIEATLYRTKLARANLLNARLCGAILIGTHLQEANLKGCAVQGIFAWGLKLRGANQQDLVINHPRLPKITVDNLEIAQLVHLRLYRENYTRHFKWIPTKIITVLGHFSKDRLPFLSTIRQTLRQAGCIPLKIDCKARAAPDFGMLSAIASLSKYLLIDATEPCAAFSTFRDIVFPLATPVYCIKQRGFAKPSEGADGTELPESYFNPWFYNDPADLERVLQKHILTALRLEPAE